MENIDTLTGLFKIDNKPLVLTGGQKQIFEIILKRNPKRTIVMCATQYGKSLTVSLGILIRAAAYNERWAIVAPSERKAKIIMNYVIQHLFDNPMFYSQLEISEPLEQLRRERSKQRLTFKRGGEIFILSADSRNAVRAGELLLGFGAQNIVLDESSLINDDIYANIKRMLGGYKDNFFLEIGNPFRRNHFLKTWHSDNYKKIKIGYDQGIREGRFEQSFIEEMMQVPFFKILYQCEFPESGEIDENGLTPILTEREIENAMKRQNVPTGIKRLGVDIGRGGDYTAFVIRMDNYARLLEKNKDPDLMAQVGRIKRIMKDEGISAENVYVDDIGVGGGVTDRLKEENIHINPIRVGGTAWKEEKFANIRAEAYWNLREWISKGASLEKNQGWYEISDIKYKEDSSSKLKIESKEDMRKRCAQSPDIADALMLTFAKPESAVRITVFNADYHSREKKKCGLRGKFIDSWLEQKEKFGGVFFSHPED